MLGPGVISMPVVCAPTTSSLWFNPKEADTAGQRLAADELKYQEEVRIHI